LHIRFKPVALYCPEGNLSHWNDSFFATLADYANRFAEGVEICDIQSR
jgi:hypothetical protein